jgi:DNA (cytosine-5)-methyltransferase 1
MIFKGRRELFAKGMRMARGYTLYEFFAGGGLARAGLGEGWTCLFANDISEKKAAVYRANFDPADELVVCSVSDVPALGIPEQATLAWASFPCQDLSLAGNGRGLQAERSGTFWGFWRLMAALEQQGRAVPIIALENVTGLLTSNAGGDFEELVRVLVSAGYSVGALVMDAVHFVPQSRPRLFIVAVKDYMAIPAELNIEPPATSIWHPLVLKSAFDRLPSALQDRWIWWNLPVPPKRSKNLRDIIDSEPQGVRWHSKAETEYLLSLMAPLHLAKLRSAQAAGQIQAGTLYKRMRIENGIKQQRAEVRFDDVSGCLRTPVGGSSRQILLIVEGQSVRSRLLSVREAARLMGLPDTYVLPQNYNDGYHVMGDAVAVPVVSWLEQHLLRQLANQMPELQIADMR